MSTFGEPVWALSTSAITISTSANDKRHPARTWTQKHATTPLHRCVPLVPEIKAERSSRSMVRVPGNRQTMVVARTSTKLIRLQQL